MKRKLLLVLMVILAAGLILTGCPDGNDKGKDDKPPNYGTNLITEAAILAATGTGGTTVTKVAGGYQVTGTVTAYSNWDGSVNDKRITLNIQADPADEKSYFAQANRYIIEIDFPNSAVKPIPTYTDGFQIYLENTMATANTGQWAGTWQREWPDEYDACGGVGKMKINRDLKIDPAEPASVSNVGDYQHLVLVLKFDAANAGKQYTFTISKVEVYGDSVNDLKEYPQIHDSAQLADATYARNATATPLGSIPETNWLVGWSDNRETYMIQWFKNTTASTTGGTAVTELKNWWDSGYGAFTPPTDTAGTFYYYVKITNPADDATTISRVVTITVN